jgi:gamma-glutamyltranspeptidase/glutathione hydrolase
MGSDRRTFIVATPHSLATEAALAAFEAGGNAADAALTASSVLAVVYPHMCGIGGDLFAIVCHGHHAEFINGSGACAASLSAESIRARFSSMPTYGPLSISVPGAVEAWDVMARQFGRLGLKRALTPAINLAQGGVPVAKSVARAIAKHTERIASDPGLSDLLLDNGKPLAAGDTLRQPTLAASLAAIADRGSREFYHGSLGVRWIQGIQRLDAALSTADLAQHSTERGRPLARGYRQFEILVPPPNSQGFVLLEMLGCIERGPLLPNHLGPDAPLLARIFAIASHDRDMHLGDPRHSHIPVDQLLSPSHIAEITAEANRLESTRYDGMATSADTVGIVAAESGGTWVSINQSLYSAFGSGILEPNTGIICHNRGSYFSLEPGSPNILAGSRRPAHTLMPVMVRKSGVPIAASATMGGSAHAQIHAEVLTAIIDQNKAPQEAVDNPRWLVGGLQRYGGIRIIAENRVPADVIGALRQSGLDVDVVGEWDEQVGHAQLVVSNESGSLVGASDIRADGSVAAR